jgi:hypothetical protein
MTMMGRAVPVRAAAAVPAAGGGGGSFRMGGGGGGRGGGAPMQPGQGRFNLSVYHTYRFQDEILIADGLPIIDLLDGGATSGRGGTPKRGPGPGRRVPQRLRRLRQRQLARGTSVDGGDRPGPQLLAPDHGRPERLHGHEPAPRLGGEISAAAEGPRISLGFQNLFDTRTVVSTTAGDLPLNYQPDFLDPTGRSSA